MKIGNKNINKKNGYHQVVFQGGQKIKVFPKAYLLELVISSDSWHFSSLLSGLSLRSNRTFWWVWYNFKEVMRCFSHQQSVMRTLELSAFKLGNIFMFPALVYLETIAWYTFKSTLVTWQWVRYCWNRQSRCCGHHWCSDRRRNSHCCVDRSWRHSGWLNIWESHWNSDCWTVRCWDFWRRRSCGHCNIFRGRPWCWRRCPGSLDCLMTCSSKTTLSHSCLKVHGGVPILLCICLDPLVLRINSLVIREWLNALFLNPKS